MKIKYFSYIAEQSFKTSPTGERLFFHGGFWSRPYIIPNEETERRLFKKQLWMLRILLGTLILGQPFLLIAIPNIMLAPLWYVIYLVAVMLLFWSVNWLVFRTDLSTLKRTSAPLPFVAFFRDTAKRNSMFGLVLVFLISIGFVLLGLWIVKGGINPFIGWASIIFFSLCAVLWGCTLYLKLTLPKSKE